MLLLTMTPAMVAALERYNELPALTFSTTETIPATTSEPDLSDPQPGDPISHGQVIAVSKRLRASDHELGDGREGKRFYHLNDLLRGSQVYIPPPKPKSEPTQEYKDLMARLRRDEEARAYSRMTAAGTPQTSPAHLPASATSIAHIPTAAEEDDEMTYQEAHRQMLLILNVLISIIACGIGIWIVARHWAAPARLALSMGGSGIVGVAEVAVYMGYIRRLQNAKDRERKKVERKTVADTWVIEGKGRNGGAHGFAAKKKDNGVPMSLPMLGDVNATAVEDTADIVGVRKRRKQ